MDEIITRLERIERYALIGAKNVLTVDDVAVLTALSKSYIYRLTCEKRIPYYCPHSKKIYFDKAEIETWMKQNRVNTQQEAEQEAARYAAAKRLRG